MDPSNRSRTAAEEGQLILNNPFAEVREHPLHRQDCHCSQQADGLRLLGEDMEGSGSVFTRTVNCSVSS